MMNADHKSYSDRRFLHSEKMRSRLTIKIAKKGISKSRDLD